MSVAATTWAWKVVSKLETPAERMVLLALADHHNGQNDQCFPTVRTLSKRTGYSRNAVKAALRGLERCGLITRRARHREDGTSRSNQYELHLDVDAPFVVVEHELCGSETEVWDERGPAQDPPGVNGNTPGGGLPTDPGGSCPSSHQGSAMAGSPARGLAPTGDRHAAPTES